MDPHTPPPADDHGPIDGPRTPRRPRTRRRRLRNAALSGGLVVLLAVGGGAAWATDRFLIEHVEIADVSAYEAEQATTASGT